MQQPTNKQLQPFVKEGIDLLMIFFFCIWQFCSETICKTTDEKKIDCFQQVLPKQKENEQLFLRHFILFAAKVGSTCLTAENHQVLDGICFQNGSLVNCKHNASRLYVTAVRWSVKSQTHKKKTNKKGGKIVFSYTSEEKHFQLSSFKWTQFQQCP